MSGASSAVAVPSQGIALARCSSATSMQCSALAIGRSRLVSAIAIGCQVAQGRDRERRDRKRVPAGLPTVLCILRRAGVADPADAAALVLGWYEGSAMAVLG